MIVRTYKRRRRGDLVGSQGSTGDDEDDLDLAGKSREEDDSEFSFWSSWQRPSSRGSPGIDDEDDNPRPSSLPTQKPELPQELGKRSKTALTDLGSGKPGKSSSAGQKLIMAESLLKGSKSISQLSSKSGSARTAVRSGDSGEQVPVNCSGHPKVVVKGFAVEDRCRQDPEKLTTTIQNCTVATATGVLEEDELKAIGVSSHVSSVIGPCAPPTSTLLEAQESGEMMEHVDEVNFAMDGLRPGQPLRICRASLVALLSIFGTRQHRRLLRTHGMVKSVLEAVLTVPTDDSATALAAAALLYVIAYDGQDEDFLDSPACIQFLLKLLGPVSCAVQDKKVSLLGSRLLALGPHTKSNKADTDVTVLDQGGLFLVDKVKHFLSSVKGRSDGILKLDNQSTSCSGGTLSTEWLVLLTLEKACLSTVVLEDAAGSVRRVGGHFKERLHEFGGLNTVCELAASCFANLQKVKSTVDYQLQNTLIEGSRGVGVLLRCLRVMENATFLSENNQKFLLEMILSRSGAESPNTFLEVVIRSINMISGFILSRSCTEWTLHGAQVQKSKSFNMHDSGGKVSRLAVGKGTSKLSGLTVESCKVKGSFDFDELDDASNQVIKQKKGQTSTKRENSKVTSDQTVSIEKGDTTKESDDDLLESCLLSAVKVLMNLTNDNEFGCRQVAIFGGLDAMASLIVKHFPSFHSSPSNVKAQHGVCKVNLGSIKKRRAEHQDQDLDLLVVILGVLVNLVEKDTRNRARLVSLNAEGFDDTPDGSGKRKHSIITLLCSIFLSKEGSSRGAESNESNRASENHDEISFEQGQREAENMILEAYSALLLAFLSKESLTVRSSIAQHLPKGNLSTLVPVLERFLDFHLSLNMLSSDTHEIVKEVIESCK